MYLTFVNYWSGMTRQMSWRNYYVIAIKGHDPELVLCVRLQLGHLVDVNILKVPCDNIISYVHKTMLSWSVVDWREEGCKYDDTTKVFQTIQAFVTSQTTKRLINGSALKYWKQPIIINMNSFSEYKLLRNTITHDMFYN